jgi:DNA-binding NarL/FixJ family response regulator
MSSEDSRGPEHLPGPVRVFIVDDHKLAREGLRSLLEAEGLEVVGDCGSAGEASFRIVSAGTNVAVVDGDLPDGTGIEVCRNVRSLSPGMQCLLLTSYVDEGVLCAAVLAGAAGYLLRQLRSHRIVNAVRRTAAGELLLSPSMVERVRAGLAEVRTHPKFDGLSGREREVLALMAEGRSNRQISEAMILEESKVRELVAALLTKLGFRDGAPAAGMILATPTPRSIERPSDEQPRQKPAAPTSPSHKTYGRRRSLKPH